MRVAYLNKQKPKSDVQQLADYLKPKLQRKIWGHADAESFETVCQKPGDANVHREAKKKTFKSL